MDCFVKRSVVLACLSTLIACSGNLEESLDEVLPAKEAQYKSSRSRPPLEVPPDLSSAGIQDAYLLPGETTQGSATLSGQNQTTSTVQRVILPELTDVRVDRNGDKRWLIINAPAEAVWPTVRSFWLEKGHLIRLEDPSVGIMETDWAENRADIPQGFVRNFLEKISTKLYSAATRDKFRVRLERGIEPGTTELYLSHRGAEEVAQGEGFVWQPRPSDPELEAEMLSRMLVYFGITRDNANQILAAGTQQLERAHMVRATDGFTTLALDEDFSRAWRRTGLALDRVGFTVEDRDRSRGLYFVRYIDPLKDVGLEEGDEGWLSKLKFWGEDDTQSGVSQDAYLISLIGEGDTTQVVVLNTEGVREASSTADRILSLLHEQLK